MQGFQDWPLLEDIEMVQRLNKLSPPMVLPAALSTSGRRYSRVGLWKNVLLNQGILLGWAAGVDVKELAQWYYKGSGTIPEVPVPSRPLGAAV